MVIINEADSLTRDAQAALRRTMEKYMSNMRIILCANSTSRLIAPIKSRCLLVRVAAPDENEVSPVYRSRAPSHRLQMVEVLRSVGKKEGFDVPDKIAHDITEDANGNLRKALLVLEALKMQSSVLSSSLLIPAAADRAHRTDLDKPLAIAKPDWETYCHKVADMIVQEQSPQRVMDVRAKLYELLSHCIPPTVVLKVRPPLSLLDAADRSQTIADHVVDQVDESLKVEIMHWAAVYEVRMRVGNKKIFHLEAWVVKVMSLYKVGSRMTMGYDIADMSVFQHFFYDIDMSSFD